jgi:hypothetical protein
MWQKGHPVWNVQKTCFQVDTSPSTKVIKTYFYIFWTFEFLAHILDFLHKFYIFLHISAFLAKIMSKNVAENVKFFRKKKSNFPEKYKILESIRSSRKKAKF